MGVGKCNRMPLIERPETTKIWKKHLEISFYTSVTKTIICYTVPEIWYVTGVNDNFHFGLCFAPLPPKQPKKSKLKNKEIFFTSRYYHFTHVDKKLWSDDVWFQRYGAWKMGSQMETDIEVSGPPKNKEINYISSNYFRWWMSILKINLSNHLSRRLHKPLVSLLHIDTMFH